MWLTIYQVDLNLFKFLNSRHWDSIKLKSILFLRSEAIVFPRFHKPLTTYCIKRVYTEKKRWANKNVI